jgi:DNA-binding LytR/AlgR family response regulator
VNLDYVAEVEMVAGGYGEVVLTTGARLEVSRRRVKDLIEKLGGAPR